MSDKYYVPSIISAHTKKKVAVLYQLLLKYSMWTAEGDKAQVVCERSTAALREIQLSQVVVSEILPC